MQRNKHIRRPAATAPTDATNHHTELVDSMDALLDEIDNVLEDNALEVTRTYRQKGGE